MVLNGKKALVFGAGISGIGSCRLLEAKGASVILHDGNDKLDMGKMKEELGEESRVEICLGDFPETAVEFA